MDKEKWLEMMLKCTIIKRYYNIPCIFSYNRDLLDTAINSDMTTLNSPELRFNIIFFLDCTQLTKALSNEFSRDDTPGAEATKWIEEYNPQEDSELAKTANELLGTVDDPKFSNSEVG